MNKMNIQNKKHRYNKYYNMFKSPKSTKVLIKQDSDALLKKWKDEPTINPITGRTIKVNGKAYKDLIKRFNFNPLSPSRRSPSPGPSRRSPSPGPSRRSPSPGPSRRSPSPVKSKITTAKRKNMTLDEKLVFWKQHPDINPETGRIIKINGIAYKKLIVKFGCDPLIPSRRSPSPGPSRRSPSPGPSRRSPSPGPSRRSPSPGPSRRSPSPGPSRQARNSPLKTTNKDCEEWLKNPNINPKTGRKIKTTGIVFKKLKKDCVVNEQSKKKEEKKLKTQTPPLKKTFIDDNFPVADEENIDNKFLNLGYTVTKIFTDKCILSPIGHYFNTDIHTLKKYIKRTVDYDEDTLNECTEDVLQVLSDILNLRIIIIQSSQESREYGTGNNVMYIGEHDLKYMILNPKNNPITTNYKLPVYTDKNTETNDTTTLSEVSTYKPKPQTLKIDIPKEIEYNPQPLLNIDIPDIENTNNDVISELDIQNLINDINDIKTKTKISTFMETERALLKTVGLI